MRAKGVDQEFQKLMIQAEIAALLHDIGKFTLEFVEAGIQGGDIASIHSQNFSDPTNGMINQRLSAVLSANLQNNWLLVPDVVGQKAGQLQRLGDLLTFHHVNRHKEFKDGFKLKKGQNLPLLLYLMVCADSIDSSSSKGGANFQIRGMDRKKRLKASAFKQKMDCLYFSTPLGMCQKEIDFESIQIDASKFQEDLATLLDGYWDWSLVQLIDKRNELLQLMKDRLSDTLAETRLPTNDVSLWQHSYYTASIFKAMLARHLLLEDYRADENGELVHHKEKLAYLAVRWNEDELLARVVRPKEILGRRSEAMKIKHKLRELVETRYCLGNEVYQDRNGICFLIPWPEEDDKIKGYVEIMLDEMDAVLDNGTLLKGDLRYEILCKNIGIQVLGLADLLDGDAQRLRTGPKEPQWLGLWDADPAAREICSRCGLRPAPLIAVTAGSEGDEEKVCETCEVLAREGDDVRRLASNSSRLHLLGTEKKADFLTFETDKFFLYEDGENKRVALIQGMFNLRPFLSAEAFSSILARRPDDYCKDPGKDDQSREIHNWDLLLKVVEDEWKAVVVGAVQPGTLHTFQQLLQDTFLGTTRDGRISGPDNRKLKNYIEQIVLNSPHPPDLDDAQKIALYALRQHPAPSRLARIWETTEAMCRYSVKWCEENKVRYFPLSVDPGRFLVLMPAKRAWEFIRSMYDQYLKTAGRVRHLLPFHLSAAVFYQKAPLYIGIDAMRRFSKIATGSISEWWTLDHIKKEEDHYDLSWIDHHGRKVDWRMPATIPNGDDERFFIWFWVKGQRRPVSIGDVRSGQQVRVWPSTFDYEVLDTTSRRYDIRMSQAGEAKGRPHHFLGDAGPRPYPLAAIGQWEEIMNKSIFKKMDPTQMNRMISLVGRIHLEWRGCDAETFRRQNEDYLSLYFGRENIPEFIEAAVSGSLLDLYEWQHFIGK